MDTLEVIFFFVLCSAMIGSTKFAIFNLYWGKKLKLKGIVKVKKYLKRMLIIGFAGFAFWATGAYLKGVLDYLDLAATVVSGYFCGYALFFKLLKIPTGVFLSLLPPFCLLWAVVLDSVLWAILAAILIFIFFCIRRKLLFFIEAMMEMQERHRQAIYNLMKDTSRFADKDDKFFLMKRPEILEIIASSIIREISNVKLKNVSEYTEDISWSNDLGLGLEDLEIMRLVWEEEFIIEIYDSEIQKGKVKTIKDIVDMIESKICLDVEPEQSGSNNY